MYNISFNAYKIALKLSLDSVTSFFKLGKLLSWEKYVVLKEKQISSVLKYRASNKYVYIFQFGCICFVNFSYDEIHLFLKYIQSLLGTLDHSLFLKYYEVHEIEIINDSLCKLNVGSCSTFIYQEFILDIVSIVLTKSIELEKINTDIDTLLDESEQYIYNLYSGKLRPNSKKFASAITKMIRFEYYSIHGIEIFNHGYNKNNTHNIDEIYKLLTQYYELLERFKISQRKIQDLNIIIRTYSKLSYKNYETKLYWFEIFLLGICPLFYIIKLIH